MLWCIKELTGGAHSAFVICPLTSMKSREKKCRGLTHPKPNKTSVDQQVLLLNRRMLSKFGVDRCQCTHCQRHPGSRQSTN